MTSIDIILPVRDGEATISAAIESILNQDYRDFQLFVIDDGSIDATPQIIRNLANNDSRIRILIGARTGIVSALNLGISAGTAPLIARMDADDIALPDRLSRQSETFAMRPDLVLLGTRIEWFGTKEGFPSIVTGARACQLALGLFTPFCHPTIMMRRSALESLDRQYDPEFEYSEDWELFSRLSQVGEVDNLKSVHLLYRIHEKQISNTQKSVQISAQSRIAKKHQQDSLGIHSKTQEVIMWVKSFILLRPSNWRQIIRAMRRRANSVV